MLNSTRYAKTLFDVSLKSNCVSTVHSELQSIAYLYTKTPSFRMVLITKRLSSQDKVDIILKTLTMFNPLVIELLSIRLETLPIIAYLFILNDSFFMPN